MRGTRVIVSCAALIFAAGCGGAPDIPFGPDVPITVVLTFDDGPFAADQPLSPASGDFATLGPLREILDVLSRRQIQAVFYVAARGPDNAAPELKRMFGDGLAAIHGGGHVIGYHAFNHDAGIWADPEAPPPLAIAAMMADLNRLERYIDDALAGTNLARWDVMTNVFRQPFGGLGLLAFEGQIAAALRGWVYHGFWIDSVDWTVNVGSDPGITRRLPVQTAAQHIAYVQSRLQAGAAACASRQWVDVLLHVNAFTSAHLDEWIDGLASDLSARFGRPVEFAVPDEYLRRSDSYVDMSAARDELWGRQGVSSQARAAATAPAR